MPVIEINTGEEEEGKTIIIIKAVSLWHVIDGRLRHISQTASRDNSIIYYTDGEKEEDLWKTKRI